MSAAKHARRCRVARTSCHATRFRVLRTSGHAPRKTLGLISFSRPFPSRRRHTRCASDWSSDVCSSDLMEENGEEVGEELKELTNTIRIIRDEELEHRSEERRVGKESRSRWSPYH